MKSQNRVVRQADPSSKQGNTKTVIRLLALSSNLILLEESRYEDPPKLAGGTIDSSEVMEDDAPDHGKPGVAFVERVRRALVNSPTRWTREQSLFLRRGDYWVISYHGQAALLKSTRGLQCLAVLLSHPGREFHVSELLARFVDPSTGASWVPASGCLRDAGDQLVPAAFSDANPVLDARSKAEYKHRLDDLRQELSEAEKFNDRGGVSHAR